MKSGEELALEGATGSFAYQADIDNPADLARLEPGGFATVGTKIHLALAGGAEPPPRLSFSVRKASSLHARPTLGGWTGEGFSLRPGERMAFQLEDGAQRELRFFWAREALRGGQVIEAGLRVRFGKEELVRLSAHATVSGAGEWHSLPLPSQAGEFTFELEGLVLAAVLAPTLVPSERVAAAERKPDLVLFLADTLRADCVSDVPGSTALMPAVSKLASESRRFRAARSPSTWTLPSQATMLSGLFPEQHGATTIGNSLPEEVVTVAEVLRAAGYRTGAVTDSAFVSRHFGLDQGFEWFQESRSWSLAATLRSALDFRAADDGRPMFLFVQTYRTHWPYRSGPEEDRSEVDRIAPGLKRGNVLYGGDGSVDNATAGREMRRLYDEGVRALDRQFGEFWEPFRSAGPAPLVLCFASDHGESFLEHEKVGHGGTPWEEKVRIPLFLWGPGIAPGVDPRPASLVDLPRTFAALAGVEAPAPWEGEDLLSPSTARATYSFVRMGARSVVVVFDGTRKLLAEGDPETLARGEFRGGTDLARDPGELRNLAQEEGWGADLARAHVATIAELTRAATTARKADLSAQDRAFLDDLGYGGD